MLATWLAAELAVAGLHVLETPGWQTRQTRAGFDPLGVVCHDTVTAPGLSREAEQGILIHGRPDLAGPLSQVGVHRDGYVSVIAAGRCNHNGYGSWGNDAYGIEVFCYGGEVGHTEPYNAAQRLSAARISAVLCRHHGWDSWHVKGHKETDPTRKIDPYGTDMGAMRAAVTLLLHPAPPPPPPDPVPSPPEDDMPGPNEELANATQAVIEVYRAQRNIGTAEAPILVPGREPDGGGVAYWAGQMVAPGADPAAVLRACAAALDKAAKG